MSAPTGPTAPAPADPAFTAPGPEPAPAGPGITSTGPAPAHGAVPSEDGHGASTQAREYGRLRLDRIVGGVLVGGAGVAWLMDAAGASVPWHLFPSIALVVVGLALVASLAGGRGRGRLIGLGALLLVVAATVGIGVDRFAGPVGDQTVAPAAADWPLTVRHSAGTVTVDLTSHPLPPAGRLDVSVGTGRLVLVVPVEAPVRVDARVVTGDITVDGDRAGDGIDVRWSSGAAGAAVVVAVEVGVGQIEVTHERP